MIRALAAIVCAPTILAFQQASDATDPPPAALAAYIKDGIFEPGDYRWMRGRFDNASPAEKDTYAAVTTWKTRCAARGMDRARTQLKALNVDPAKLEPGLYSDDLCAEVAFSTPDIATTSWPAFERDLAAARPYADTYLFAVAASGSGVSPDPTLRSRLLNRSIAEQMTRRAMSWGAGDAANAPKLPERTRPIVMALLGRATLIEDRANTRWLDEIMTESGWPGIAAVGEGASTMAWLMVQHADHDPAFQLRVLRAMEPMLASGDIRRADYAYLYDRVMLKIAGQQRYATQMYCKNGLRVPRPLEDTTAVDRLRAEAKMPSLADYRST